MNWKQWLQGLIAAVVSAFSTAASGAITLPSVFSWDRNGLINMVKLATVPAMLAFFAYLKQNPTFQLTAGEKKAVMAVRAQEVESGKPTD